MYRTGSQFSTQIDVMGPFMFDTGNNGFKYVPVPVLVSTGRIPVCLLRMSPALAIPSDIRL